MAAIARHFSTNVPSGRLAVLIGTGAFSVLDFARMSKDHTALMAVLELAASERKELLPWLLDVILHSPARWTALEHGRRWQTRPEVDELAGLVLKTARDLDRLERSRRAWRHPRQVVEAPHLATLYSFAQQRRDRVASTSRSRRLGAICRKLKNAYDDDRQRQMLVDSLNEPATPVDPGRLREFLGGKGEPTL